MIHPWVSLQHHPTPETATKRVQGKVPDTGWAWGKLCKKGDHPEAMSGMIKSLLGGLQAV